MYFTTRLRSRISPNRLCPHGLIRVACPGLQALIRLWGEDISGNLVATTITSLIFSLGILGQYTGGRVPERYEPRFCYLAFNLVSMSAAFFMAMAQNLSLVTSAIIYLFFLLGMQPIENTLVARFTPPRFHHSAYGIKFVLTFGVAALAVKMLGAFSPFGALTPPSPPWGSSPSPSLELLYY